MGGREEGGIGGGSEGSSGTTIPSSGDKLQYTSYSTHVIHPRGMDTAEREKLTQLRLQIYT